MKHIFAIITALAFTSVFALAQEQSDAMRADSLQNELDAVHKKEVDRELDKSVWGKGRYSRLGFAWAQTVDEIGPVCKSSFAFFATKGATYFIPSRPIAGMLKFGVDVKWFDFQFSKFNSPDDDLKWSSEIDESFSDGDEDYIGFPDLKLSRMSMTLGMFGVGPYVSVAPLTFTGNKNLAPLRVSAYFHYIPTVGAYAYLNDGDMEASYAYVNMMDLGVNISWRIVSLGVEGHWGSGKFKPVDFESMIGESGPLSMGTKKYTRKFASTRLYVQLKF